MSMPSELEQRRYWRGLWLSSIQAFADSETQKTRWTDPNERNPHFSFVECMCCYFDDAYLGEPQAYAKKLELGRLTADEVGAVAEFHVLAAAYRPPNEDDWDVNAILSDPAWQRVVEAAQQAQRRLLALLADETEREDLIRPLLWEEKDGVFSAGAKGTTIIPSRY